MILQRDKELKPQIQKYGCYLMCLIKIALDRGAIPEPTASRVNFYYETFLKAGFINENCLVKSPDRILGFLGVQCKQAFTESNGVAMPVTYKPFDGEIEILCYSMPTYDHFVLPTYDPYGGSPAVTKGKLTSKRIFRTIKTPVPKPDQRMV